MTVTSAIQGTSAATPEVWQFRTQVTSGSGQFVNSGQNLGSNNGGRVLLGDVDGDGDVDVIEGGNGILRFNDGNAVFTDSGQTLNSGGEGGLADIDGDGDLDVVGVTNVLLNDGNGIFTGTGQNLPGNTIAWEILMVTVTTT